MERIKITKINDHIWLLNDNNEAKSLKRFHIDFPDGKREFSSVDCHTEQTACDNDVIIRSVFTKVFERSQGTCLFITKDEVANSFFNVYLKNSRKEGKNLCLNMRVPSFWEENCYDLYRST